MAVERDVGIGEVVHEQEPVLAREVDQPLHVLRGRDGGRRVVRVRDDHDLRGARADALLDRVDAAGRGRRDDARPGEPGRDAMDRVGGRGDDDGVAGLDQHPHQVREALLGADRARDLRLRVEPHTEASLVVLGNGDAQLRDAPARGVAMVGRLRGGLLELLDGDSRRGDVRVAEPEVDHVEPLTPKLALQLVDAREDVRRQVVDPTKLHFGKYCRCCNGR